MNGPQILVPSAVRGEAPPFDLYLITDPDAPGGVIDSVAAALERPLPPGRVAVQLRAKSWSQQDLAYVGRALRDLTQRSGVSLILNGPCQLARKIGADGVQLPEDGPSTEDARRQLGERALIGRSCHDLAGLEDASGADFVTLSPYYAVNNKGQPLSAANAAAFCAASTLPVFALGGIGLEQVEVAIAGGAWGVALIRAVFFQPCPAQAIAQLLQRLDQTRARPPSSPPALQCPAEPRKVIG